MSGGFREAFRERVEFHRAQIVAERKRQEREHAATEEHHEAIRAEVASWSGDADKDRERGTQIAGELFPRDAAARRDFIAAFMRQRKLCACGG